MINIEIKDIESKSPEVLRKIAAFLESMGGVVAAPVMPQSEIIATPGETSELKPITGPIAQLCTPVDEPVVTYAATSAITVLNAMPAQEQVALPPVPEPAATIPAPPIKTTAVAAPMSKNSTKVKGAVRPKYVKAALEKQKEEQAKQKSEEAKPQHVTQKLGITDPRAQFPAFIHRITTLINADQLTTDDVLSIIDSIGPIGLPEYSAHPELIPVALDLIESKAGVKNAE